MMQIQLMDFLLSLWSLIQNIWEFLFLPLLLLTVMDRLAIFLGIKCANFFPFYTSKQKFIWPVNTIRKVYIMVQLNMYWIMLMKFGGCMSAFTRSKLQKIGIRFKLF